MIDVRTEKGNTEIKVIHGTVTELLADCAIIISLVYRTMKKKEPECAAAFKDILQSGFLQRRHWKKAYTARRSRIKKK